MLRRLLLSAAVVGTLGTAAAAQDAVELKVMIFNIWRGGEQVNWLQTLEAIRAADPDILLLQEPEGQTRALAEALGWPYVSERQHTIARVPLYDPSAPAGTDPLFLYAEVAAGQVVALANIHLPSDPYGPYAVHDGTNAEELAQLEADTRLWMIEPSIAALGEQAAAGVPLLLGGDFNAPSHLDWTEATIGRQAHITYAFEWPVSKALADAGFTDVYRAAHPDPLATPGITWPAGYPVPYLIEGEALDRIDQLYAAGPVEVLEAVVVGEAGGPDVAISVTPWPSDHRAVLATLQVQPAEAPAAIGFGKRGVTQGEILTLRYLGGGGDGRLEDGRVEIEPSGGGEVLLSLPSNDTTDRLTVAYIGTAPLAPGAYDAVLRDGGGQELARNTFWVQAPGSLPSVTLEGGSVTSGAPITAAWSGAPGHRRDWIGVYAAGDSDPYNYYGFAYTEAAVAGEVVLDENAIWEPLPPGTYELRLMLDDAYTVLAVSAPFEVTE